MKTDSPFFIPSTPEKEDFMVEKAEEKKDQETTEEEVTQLSDEELKEKTAQAKSGAGEKKETIKPEVKPEKIEVSPKPKGDEKPEVKIELSAEEKIRKQVEDKEAFIQKQAQEIGNLRKKVKEFESPHEDAKTRERLKEKFSEDPLAATEEAIFDIETRKGKQRDLIKSLIPNLEEIKEDIAVLVREEGSESEEAISLFLANPYVADPVKLRYWAALAMHKKDKETLSKQVEDLKGQLQTTGKDVLKKIEKAAQETKTLTAKTGAEAEEETTTLTEEQISYLSDEELKRLTKKTVSQRT